MLPSRRRTDIKMSFSKTYIKKPVRLFLESFKSLPLTLGIDIIFYIFFFLGFRIYASKAKEIILSLQNLDLSVMQDLNNVDAAASTELLNQLQSFMDSIIFVTIVFIIYIIIILTLIKGYQWNKIVKKKIEALDYVKLLILNTVWFIFWIIIFSIPFSFIEKQTYLTNFVYYTPIIPLFTTFLYMNYAETKSVFKALFAPISEGIIKLHKYTAPIIILTLFFQVPIMILKPFRLQSALPLIVFVILSLITLSLLKLFFYKTYKS